ncbi:MAG: hypothetical protein WDW38_009370 [Sanguina aurantia]
MRSAAASSSEAERWRAMGGSVQEAVGKSKAVYIAPSGDKLKSWAEAAKLMKEADNAKGATKPEAAEDAKPDTEGAPVAAAPAAAEAPKKAAAKRARPAPKAAAAAAATAAAAPAAAAGTSADEDAADAPLPPQAAKKPRVSNAKKAATAAAPAPAAAAAVTAAAVEAAAAAAADAAPAAAADDVIMGEQAAADKENVDVVAVALHRVRRPTRRPGPGGVRTTKKDRVAVVEEGVCASEAEALEATNEVKGIRRRLMDFSVVDEAGQVQAVERVALMPGALFISGVVYPALDTAMSKDKGRRVTRFGPIKEWKSVYSKGECQVQLKTASGVYTLSRPSPAFRKLFAALEEQLALCSHVYQALCPEVGGSLTITLDEMIAKLARSKVGKQYGSAREALLLNGKFVASQLAAMAEAGASSGRASSKSAVVPVAETVFALALAAEVAKGPLPVSHMSGSIRILEPTAAVASDANAPAGNAMVDFDEDMARRLQAKMDKEEFRKSQGVLQGVGGGRGGGGGGGRGGASATSGPAYIKISEEEIADDYPLPAQYAKEGEETDELVMFDEDCMDMDPEELPKRTLTEFAIYNAEGFYSSLELLPMWAGIDSDVELFASGVVGEDHGDWADATAAPAAASDGAGGSGSSASADAPAAATAGSGGGMRLYLSQIREWVVEASFDFLAISIRTDVAWYKLSIPTERYGPWFRTVRRSAQLSLHILGLLSEESRASKLSFADIVKRLAELPETSPVAVSKKLDVVERFVVVHGQIILNQFAHFPTKAVRESAFATMLKQRMEARRHSKLYMSKVKGGSKAVVKTRTANPMKNRSAANRAKPMPATATTMVKTVWTGYFFGAGKKVEEGETDEAAVAAALDPVAAAAAAIAPAPAKEVEEDENDEDVEGEEESALAQPTKGKKAGKGRKARAVAAEAAAAAGSSKAAVVAKPAKKAAVKVQMVGKGVAGPDGITVYPSCKLGADLQLAPGTVIIMDADEDDEPEVVVEGEEALPVQPPLGLVQCVYEDAEGGKCVQVRLMLRGYETVLGDAGSDYELYLSEEFEERPMAEVAGVVAVCTRLQREGSHLTRRAEFAADEVVRKHNLEARANGEPLHYVYRHLYRPTQGMFCCPPEDLELGSYHEAAAEVIALAMTADGAGFIKEGVSYLPGDFLYLHPDAVAVAAEGHKSLTTAQEEDNEEEEKVPEYAAKGGKHKGSNKGLRAFAIAQLVAVTQGSTSTASNRKPDAAKPTISLKASFLGVWGFGKEHSSADLDTFRCTGSFNPAKPEALGPPPASLSHTDIPAAAEKGKGKAATADKGKGKASSAAAAAAAGSSKGGNLKEDEEEDEEAEPCAVSLATMDIFAGCGGLSEGMHQTGVVDTRWAVEYEQPAADAFQLNNPDAKVLCNNCNALLRAVMEKAGIADDCDACEDAMEAAARLSPETIANLPLPGEVDFLMGGPPCQGYSGMNRFNKGNWSLVQNSMVMAYLSYCEFYRPRYFLLENVRNFVSHNKSFTFRLTLRTLLDMGYQVRFGVLNAGNFGVPQSRKRTIIWAARPGEALPAWPTPRHVFISPQLKINLPGGVTYCAVPDLPGAPLRAVTVKDAIGDLPHITNGASTQGLAYTAPAVSAFQRFIRGGNPLLQDHICKEMNELNMERCRCIPRNTPGADWRVLQQIVREDPARETYKGQPLVPWCLPNTADRHNGWRGLFGRLDLNGHFPTSTTDPQPMGKVGQVFHPEQDRIVSVRECARSQGFPDRFCFSGNVHNRHRQIGNAVPPPLARALPPSCARRSRPSVRRHQSCAIDQAATSQQQQLERWYHSELPTAIASRDPPHMKVDEHLRLLEWKLSRGHKRPWLMGQAKLLTEQQVFDATSGAFAALAGYCPADGVAVVKRAIALMNAMKSVGPATASAALAAVCPHTPFMSDTALATALSGRKVDYTPKAYLELVAALQGKAQELSSPGGSRV